MRVNLPTGGALLLILTTASAWAATEADLYTSMAVPSTDVASATVIGAATGYDVLSSLGVISPTEGSDFAILHTGQVGVSPEPGTDRTPSGTNGDATTLSLDLVVPSTANSFVMDFYFLSAEYPEWVGSVYNDEFQLNISGTAWSGNAAIDSGGNVISINSALFTVVSSVDLMGTGFDGVGGGTGWLSIVVPVDPGDTVNLEMYIYDRSDGVYDSAVILDNFEWQESDIDEPIIIETITLNYLSPKRGPSTGGTSTVLYGEKFNETCVAWFDGVEAPTTYIDEARISAVPPAHTVGLVDVKVTCTGTADTLLSGYTYYETEGGTDAPLITGVDPYTVDVSGGETVQITGSDFADGVVVTIADQTVDTTRIDDQTLSVVTPAHVEGLVDVVVTNPDGLADTRVGGLQYVDFPTWPPEDTGPIPDPGDTAALEDETPKGEVGCACSTAPGASSGALLAGMLGLVTLLRRRK